LLDLGIPRAGHSDSPVSTADPLMHIQGLVTRTSAERKTYGATQCITPEQAIAAWTFGGAFACFSEQQTGSITSGKLADFLDADPTAIAPEQIMKIGVKAAYIEGHKVFDAGLHWVDLREVLFLADRCPVIHCARTDTPAARTKIHPLNPTKIACRRGKRS
jgi:imidazolonepropionase-like amidohydrolase